MSLIVEDGTGRGDAESYASVAEADTYHAARGNTAWEPLDPEIKEQALRKATDYLESTYYGGWKGFPSTTTQALRWPRLYVYPDPDLASPLPSDEVPVLLRRACCDLALRAASSALVSDESASIVASEQVGPLSVTYTSTGSQQTRYAAVERMLTPLLQAGGNSMQATAELA